MTKLLFILSLLFPVSLLAGNKYYFSVTGSDAGAGTIGSPWQTVAKFNSLLLNGDDSIFFKGGDHFPGVWYFSRSGTLGHQIYYGSYGTGQAVLTGFFTASGWTNVSGNIYQTSFTASAAGLKMVRLNGSNQGMGRWPDITAPNGGYLTLTAPLINGFTNANPATDTSISYIGSTVVCRTHNEDLSPVVVSAQSGASITTATNFTYGVPIIGFGYFFQNALWTLNLNGEWFQNNSTNKFQMYFSGTPSTQTVELAQTDTVATVTGSYSTFDNITIEGANKFNMAFTVNAFYDTLKNCNIQFAGINNIEVSTGTSASLYHCAIMNCNVIRANNNGLSIIYPAQFNDGWIDLTRFGLTALIPGAGVGGAGTNGGVQFFGLRDTITRSKFDSCGGPGWAQYGGDTCFFQYDRFTHNGLVTADVGGIYFSVHSGVRNTIDHCIADNCLSNNYGTDQPVPIYGVGFYLDSRATNVSLKNCLAFGNSYNGCFLHMARLNLIDSCTFVFNNTSQLYLQADGDSLYHNTMTNSILVSKDSSSTVVTWYTGSQPPINSAFIGNSNNVYARPKRDGTIFRNNGGAKSWYTLAQWKALMGQDANSKSAPIAISNDNAMLLYYNPTFSDSSVSVPQGYLTARGAPISQGTYVLHPFTSLVLIPLGIYQFQGLLR